MAKFEFQGLDKYEDLLADLGAKATGMIKRAVYVGADIVANKIKANLRATGHSDTGALLSSMSLDKMKDKNGFIYTKISWVGRDAKGTPNALKAAALESGTKNNPNYPKTHFVSSAVKWANGPASAAMAKQFDQDTNKIMNQ